MKRSYREHHGLMHGSYGSYREHHWFVHGSVKEGLVVAQPEHGAVRVRMLGAQGLQALVADVSQSLHLLLHPWEGQVIQGGAEWAGGEAFREN